MVAFAAVLFEGILKGVIVAVLVSMLLLIRRAAHPHVAFLGRIPDTRRYSDLARNPDNEAVPGALVFRVEASLLYFNAEHVRDTVLEKLRTTPKPVRLVVCDLSATPYVDVTGALMLMGLQASLQATGIDFRLVEAHAAVRDLLRVGGLEARTGSVSRRISLNDVIESFRADEVKAEQ